MFVQWHVTSRLALAALAFLASSTVRAESLWLSAPKPKFPASALKRGTEGYVILRAYLTAEGNVTRTTVVRSSGDAALDNTAGSAVLKWKMKPAAIKPTYLTKGYELRIDFRQETPIAARYRDRRAYFQDFQSAKIWTYAPFPEYPFHERLLRTEGVTLVRGQVGPDGRVASVSIAKSSGNANLDRAALAAVSSWRAHAEYAGQRFVLPIKFVMDSTRPFR